MRCLIISVCSLLVAAGVWGAWRHHEARAHPARASHSVNVAEFESDLTEALARHIFADLQNHQPLAYFLALGENRAAPSRAFLARFDNVQPKVKVYQASVLSPNGMILDKSTGRVGIIVQIIKIRPVVGGVYDVDVAIFNARSADHFVYRVSELAGEWQVRSCKPA